MMAPSDFDDDDTVLAKAPVRDLGDLFDDDDTVLSASPMSTGVTGHPTAVTSAAGLVDGASRSLEALQQQAPYGPGWRPPERPTLQPMPQVTVPRRSRRGWVWLAAALLLLALLAGLAAFGLWYLVAGPGDRTGTDPSEVPAVEQSNDDQEPDDQEPGDQELTER